MLPQRVKEEAGYRVKGRTEDERRTLLADAQALVEEGAFAIVLELVTPPVAREITAAVPVPTLGIGSGPDCDGQIRVLHDLIGLFPWFTPKFVQPKLRVAEQIRAAVAEWAQSIAASGS